MFKRADKLNVMLRVLTAHKKQIYEERKTSSKRNRGKLGSSSNWQQNKQEKIISLICD